MVMSGCSLLMTIISSRYFIQPLPQLYTPPSHLLFDEVSMRYQSDINRLPLRALFMNSSSLVDRVQTLSGRGYVMLNDCISSPRG